MEGQHDRRRASHQVPCRQCGLLLVGFGQETEQQSITATVDGNLVRVIDRSTSLLEALDEVRIGRIGLVLFDSLFSEEELMLFVCDARRHGFRGMAFRAAGNPADVPRISPRSAGDTGVGVAQSVSPNATAESDADKHAIAFTEKERAVLERVSRGWTNFEIASDLGCSLSAVKGTIQQLFRKLGVRKRAQIVRIAFERGFRGSPTGQQLFGL